MLVLRNRIKSRHHRCTAKHAYRRYSGTVSGGAAEPDACSHAYQRIAFQKYAKILRKRFSEGFLYIYLSAVDIKFLCQRFGKQVNAKNNHQQNHCNTKCYSEFTLGRTQVKLNDQDSAIAMFWTLGMSVGIICCFLTPGFMPDLPSFLFGSILTIGTGDLWLLGILTAFVCILFTLFLRPIQSVAFDRTFSLSQHLPVALIEYMMMALIAMTIVATLKMVGIVLAISLLTIPQMTASIFTFSYRRLILYSIFVGWFDCLIGLLVSYQFNVPSGATIIFVSILTFALCKTIKAGISQFYKK